MVTTVMDKAILMVIGYFSLMALDNANICVSGDAPYNSAKQVCCKGTVQERAGNNTNCCGTNAYDGNTKQCCDDQSTVVDQTNGKEALTCCAGVGVVAQLNQMCCGGKLVERPQVLFPSDNFACCNDIPYITQRQSCCNGVVSDDANQALGCCDGVSYDTGKQICCNGTAVVSVPATSQRYSYQCCGLKGYDTSKEICDQNTGTVYQKPANASCQSVYQQVCGGKVLNPNELCCNEQAFRPPLVWIDDGSGTGSGGLGSLASCCSSGKGLIQDPAKETCCDQGNGGTLPIDVPTQACCAGKIIDTTVNKCCAENIVQVPSDLAGCCGTKSYDYNTQICCGDQVYDKSQGYDTCCVVPVDIVGR